MRNLLYGLLAAAFVIVSLGTAHADPAPDTGTTLLPLTVNTESGTGTGTVKSRPSGIDCGSTCNADYPKGTQVTLTPAPDEGSIFSNWSGGCTGKGACVVTMSKPESVEAVFKLGSCTYNISPKSETLSYKGGTINVTITAKGSTSCPAPVISNNPDWITVGTPKFSMTSGTVKLTIPAYGSSIQRPGSVTIGGDTFNVTQEGKPCTVALSAPSSDVFPNSGGTGQFTVAATPADCVWTAKGSSASGWVSVKSGTPGTGAGTVVYSVGAYKGKASRSENINVETTQNKKSKAYAVKQSHKSILQGNPAFRASSVAGYQALGASVAYPFAALQIASPTGSTIHSLAALNPRSLLKRAARALSYPASQLTAGCNAVPEMGLCTDGSTTSGNVVTMGFYGDSDGCKTCTDSAGSVKLTLPAGTNPNNPFDYPTSSYPVTVNIGIDITGGNIPCTGNIKIVFAGPSGANTMTGINTLTKTGVVYTLDLGLDDDLNVSGSVTVKESGATLLLTAVTGKLVDQPLNCSVDIEPYGWTGTGTLNLLTGAMTATLDTDSGTSSVAPDTVIPSNLVITYGDKTTETVPNAPSAGLTEGITATGGTPQSATVSTAFDYPLTVTVKDSEGNPVAGTAVTFTAPGSGVSGSFDGGAANEIVNTDTSGIAASSTFTANGAAGSYTVTATAPEVEGQADFALTNMPSSAVSGYAYVVDYLGLVSQYIIGANGEFTPMKPATVSALESDVCSIAAVPSGKYAYVVSSEAYTVSQYVIGVNGGLKPMSPATVATDMVPVDIAVDPTGRYAYVANYGDGAGTISQYTIGTDGALKQMKPASVASGTAALAVAATQTSVYAVNYDQYGEVNVLYQFTIGPDGTLTPMKPSTVNTGQDPYSVAVDPSGKYAYVTNYTDGTVSQFTIGSDGTLSPMTTPTVAAGLNPLSVTVTSSYAYVVNSDATLSQYTIGANGALSPMTQATVAAGKYSGFITTDPSSKYVYVTNYDGKNVWQYTIGADGGLTPMDPATVSALWPNSIVTVPRH